MIFAAAASIATIIRLIAARTKAALHKPRGASVAAMARSSTSAPSCVKASRSQAANTSKAPTMVGFA